MLHFFRRWLGTDAGTAPPPMLDGPWSANDRLERARVLATAEDMDGLCLSSQGVVHVTVGDKLARADDRGGLTTVAQLAGTVTAIAAMPDGGFVVAVEGHGLQRLDAEGRAIAACAEPAIGVTALACDAQGRVYFAQGSASYRTSEWYQDLMRLGSSGSVGIWEPGGPARRLASGMRYPSGLARLADGSLLVSEAWAHRIVRLRPGSSAPEPVLENLAGYPGRIAHATGGGFWLPLFAMRTLLVDFVLTEDAFRQEMIETIDPLYWVRPALSSGKSYLEPLQGGAIVKLGIRKAWSPPRSYGLVCRLSDDMTATASHHSRVGGLNHGITAALDRDGQLLAVSKGAGRLLTVEDA